IIHSKTFALHNSTHFLHQVTDLFHFFSRESQVIGISRINKAKLLSEPAEPLIQSATNNIGQGRAGTSSLWKLPFSYRDIIGGPLKLYFGSRRFRRQERQ